MSPLPPSITSEIYQQRLTQWQKTIPQHTAVLLARSSHIQYLTGATFLLPAEREALLFATNTSATLITTGFFPPAALKNVATKAGVHPKWLGQTLTQLINEETDSIDVFQTDASALFLHEFQAIEAAFQSGALTNVAPSFAAFSDLELWRMRAQKDAYEMGLIQYAARIALSAFEHVSRKIVAGITEEQLQQQLDAEMRAQGGSPAFPTIVAFGPHAASPHHQPQKTPLSAEMPILIDWGCAYQGYGSDFTRTWWFGSQPDSSWQDIEKIVQAAYAAAVKKVRVGQPVADVDQAARKLIEKAGFGPQFIHTTGHGIGLDVHEPPSVYLATDGTLPENLAVTVEPGIYIPEKFGYRYENTLIVRKDRTVSLG